MTVRATVMIPTHDHGPTLLRSVPTALSQTVEEVEVLLVGDGMPAAARECARQLAREDRRVRVLENAKGPRHGEVHRHEALGRAQGQIVCYLSDDDLWLPEHLEVMESLLESADFAAAYPVRVETDGTLGDWVGDLDVPWFRREILQGTNFIPLSCAGHTLDAYRRLPHGWRTTPSGIPSDLYMWQQFLAQPWCRATSGRNRPTVLHLPASLRSGWTEEQRLQELDRWADRIHQPGFAASLYADALGRATRDLTRAWEAFQEHRRTLEGTREHLRGVEEQLRRLGEHRDDLERQVKQLHADRTEERDSLDAQIASLQRAVEQRDERIEARQRELDTLRATRMWRVRTRLLRTPLLGRTLRWAGGARGPRGGD